MDRIKITGGGELNGVIPISGAKNATLPLMIAGLKSPPRARHRAVSKTSNKKSPSSRCPKEGLSLSNSRIRSRLRTSDVCANYSAVELQTLTVFIAPSASVLVV
jgi:hypothetical protein